MRKLYISSILRTFYLSFFLFWATVSGNGQAPDTSYRTRVIPKTEIELTISFYNQNGDHSAVTGGAGTEKLGVFAPTLKLNHTFRNSHSMNFSAGADFITSASTDNIDFIKSSPSLYDTRSYLNAGYSYRLKRKDLTLNIGTGFSIESDYLSFPVSAGVEYNEPTAMRSYQFTVQAYFDDLRWGRISEDYSGPLTLVYPVELRYRRWYDTYRRNSYNFRAGFTQALGKRTILGIFPEVDYQYGLLATPYHRVYFTDDSLRVENLPGHRVKFPIGIQLNHFTGGHVIIKGNYQFYYDDFGILGNAFRVEVPVKIAPLLSITPMYRFYIQQGSKYFRPYKEHTPGEVYYTSDHDLSSFTSHDAGLLISWIPVKYAGKRFYLGELSLQYNYFHRSDGLSAHYVTFWINTGFEGGKKTSY